MYFLDTQEIEYFFWKAQKLNSLHPWFEVNSFFRELCSFCFHNEKKVPLTQEVEVMQKTCSVWECLLEKYVSHNVIDAVNPWKTLEEFEYYKNYWDLSRLEYLNLTFYWAIKSVLFLWGGALPLTAILLAKNYKISSTIIDYDIEAYETWKQLIKTLGLQDFIQYSYWDAYSYHDIKEYDACYIAALVWQEEEKQRQLLKYISFSIKAGLFVLRSSHGTRELLYKKVSLWIVRECLQIEHIIHPKNHIINSIIIAKKYD